MAQLKKLLPKGRDTAVQGSGNAIISTAKNDIATPPHATATKSPLETKPSWADVATRMNVTLDDSNNYFPEAPLPEFDVIAHQRKSAKE